MKEGRKVKQRRRWKETEGKKGGEGRRDEKMKGIKRRIIKKRGLSEGREEGETK